MPQIARVVVPDMPHHVCQRGNRNQPTFFSGQDKTLYLKLLQDQIGRAKVKLWAYCLMDNHVHFVAVPAETDSLGRCFGETHKRYTKIINKRRGWRGFLWQGRYSSYVMDEPHLYAAVRYVERNPLKAGMVQKPEEYRWSSAKAHVSATQDPLLSKCHLEDEIEDWSEYLKDFKEAEEAKIERHLRNNLPIGSHEFIQGLEEKFNLSFTRQPAGRPKRNN